MTLQYFWPIFILCCLASLSFGLGFAWWLRDEPEPATRGTFLTLLGVSLFPFFNIVAAVTLGALGFICLANALTNKWLSLRIGSSLAKWFSQPLFKEKK